MKNSDKCITFAHNCNKEKAHFININEYRK